LYSRPNGRSGSDGRHCRYWAESFDLLKTRGNGESNRAEHSGPKSSITRQLSRCWDSTSRKYSLAITAGISVGIGYDFFRGARFSVGGFSSIWVGTNAFWLVTSRSLLYCGRRPLFRKLSVGTALASPANYSTLSVQLAERICPQSTGASLQWVPPRHSVFH